MKLGSEICVDHNKDVYPSFGVKLQQFIDARQTKSKCSSDRITSLRESSLPRFLTKYPYPE